MNTSKTVDGLLSGIPTEMDREISMKNSINIIDYFKEGNGPLKKWFKRSKSFSSFRKELRAAVLITFWLVGLNFLIMSMASPHRSSYPLVQDLLYACLYFQIAISFVIASLFIIVSPFETSVLRYKEAVIEVINLLAEKPLEIKVEKVSKELKLKIQLTPMKDQDSKLITGYLNIQDSAKDQIQSLKELVEKSEKFETSQRLK